MSKSPLNAGVTHEDQTTPTGTSDWARHLSLGSNLGVVTNSIVALALILPMVGSRCWLALMSTVNPAFSGLNTSKILEMRIIPPQKNIFFLFSSS